MFEDKRTEPDGEVIVKEKKSISWTLFDTEGPVIGFLTKAGELLLLSLVFVVFCLPVVTIGPACTALYCAVVKNIRHSRGYPIREFIQAFKKRFKISFFAGLIMLSVMAGMVLIYINTGSRVAGSKAQRIFIVVVTLILTIFYYLYPIISRFRISLGNAFIMAFIIGGEHFLTTVALIVSGAAVIYLYLYLLPIITFPLIPGIWVYLMSFLIEKVLIKYMPPPSEEDKEKWYYEQNQEFTRSGSEKQ